MVAVSYRFRPVASLPAGAGRYQIQAVLLPSGKVLLVGGSASTTVAPPFATANCFIYDPALDTYTQTGSLHHIPYSVGSSTSIGLLKLRGAFPYTDNRILCVYSSAGTPYAETYDETTGVWTQLVSAPTVSGSRPVLFENYRTSGGGQQDVLICYDDNPATSIFNVTTNLFIAGPSVPTNFSGAATSGYGSPGYAYFSAPFADGVVRAGGTNMFGSTASNVLCQSFRYSFSSGAWSATNAMWYGQNTGTICMMDNDIILAAGGRLFTSDECERFDVTATFNIGSWFKIDPPFMSEGMHHATSFRMADDKIAVFSGRSSAFATIYNRLTNTWSDSLNAINTVAPYAGTGNKGHYGIVQLNDPAKSVMFFGGNSTGVDSGAWIFTDDFFTAGTIAASTAGSVGKLTANWRAQGLVQAVGTPAAAASVTLRAQGAIPVQSIVTGTAGIAKAAFRLESMTPGAVHGDGGYPLDLFGEFLVGVPLTVHVGLVGSTNDPLCYSGIPGQGYTIYATSAQRIRAYTPQLIPGLYNVTVSTGVQSATLSQAVRVHPPEVRLGTLALRQVLPPFWKTGPRNLEHLKKID